MSKYQAKSDSQTSGINILNTIQALGSFKGTASSYLEKCGLKDVKADQWYPMQSYCDFFELLADNTGSKTLHVIGRSLGQNIALEEEAETIGKVYEMFNADFRTKFINTHPDEGFLVNQTSATSCQIVFTGSFPSEFIRGMLEGIGRQLSDIEYITVTIDESQPRIETGGKSTTYLMNWR